MKILLYGWVENVLVLRHWARYLEQNHKELNIEKFTFLTSRNWETEKSKTIPLNTENEIINIYEDFSYDKLPKTNFEELRKYEKLYGMPNLWLYIVTEREFFDIRTNELYYNRFKNIPEDKTYDLLIWYFKKFEKLFDKKKFDLFVTIDIPGLEGLILNNIAEKKNCKYFIIDTSRIPERLRIIKDAKKIPDKLKEIFKELSDRKLTDEEEKIADELLDIYNVKQYRRLMPWERRTRIFKLFKFMNLVNIFKIIKSNIPRIETNIFKLINIAARERVRMIYLKIFRKTLFDEYNTEEKYFYYPLHEQPEIAIDYMNPFLQNQIELIINIAKTLPAGYLLYVKDHPASFGRKPISFYKRIKKIPNVKMFYHFENGYLMVKNSIGVITIFGTAGWEAFLLGKPVVTLAEVFYNLAEKSVFNVNNFFELALVLQKIIEEFKADKEHIKKIVLAKYYFTFSGKTFPLAPFDEVISEENLRNITAAVIKEYKDLNQNLK